MRICLYTETALPKTGGQELVVDALAREFTALGHDATVLVQYPRKPLQPADEQLPYRVVRHPRFVSTRHFVGWYRYWLEREHRRTPFDVVHCHSVHPCGYVAALAKPAIAAPVVITSHGGDVRADNPRFAKPGLRRRHEFAVAQADALIAISRFTAEGYLRLGAAPAKIVELPNGVEVARLQSPAARPSSLVADVRPRNFLLFLGRLNRRKGVDVLLRALARIPAGERLPLVVAGDGDERAMLQASAATLGLGRSVHFVGRVAGDFKTFLLQNARAVVIPSRDWEAFPLVVLEAFAAGTPVVGTRIPGLADLVDDGRAGIGVATESPDDLARVLRHVIAQPERMLAMGSAAAARAAEFDWRAVAERHLDCVSRLRTVSHRRAA